MSHFAGKVAIVTGGASGIGRALCDALEREGATVVSADIDGSRAGTVVTDVRDPGAVDRLVDGTVAKHGRLDFMFNNAGVACLGEIRDLPLEQWQRVIDVNLWGVIHGVRAAYRVMLKQGAGHIVNVASGFGLAPGTGYAPYVASKFAVVGLSETLRLEAKDLGVRVTAICPGFVQTPLVDKVPATKVDVEKYAKGIPVKVLSPEACAKMALDGVRKNKAIVAFPLYTRIAARLWRSWPRIYDLVGLKTIRDLRKVRTE